MEEILHHSDPQNIISYHESFLEGALFSTSRSEPGDPGGVGGGDATLHHRLDFPALPWRAFLGQILGGYLGRILEGFAGALGGLLGGFGDLGGFFLFRRVLVEGLWFF